MRAQLPGDMGTENRVYFYGRQLQVHIPGIGWRVAGSWDPSDNTPSPPEGNP